MRKAVCNEPKLRELITAYRFEILEGEKAKELECHLSRCQMCADEFYGMLMLTEELKQNSDELQQILSQLRVKRQSLFSRWRYQFLRSPFVFRLVSCSVALLLIVSAGLYMQKGPSIPLPGPTITTRGPLHLLEPRPVVTSAPALFEWEAVLGAQLYIIEITDVQSGTLVAREQSDTNSLGLPDRIQKKLQPGRVYLWEVKAQEASGRVIASASREFTIQSPYER